MDGLCRWTFNKFAREFDSEEDKKDAVWLQIRRWQRAPQCGSSRVLRPIRLQCLQDASFSIPIVMPC